MPGPDRDAPHLVRILAVAVALLTLAAPAAAVECGVPVDKPTIAAALADPACDPIIVAAGTYAEAPLTVSRSVTIQGPNAGIPGAGVRGAEAALTGASDGFRISAGTVVLDGLRIDVDGAGVTTTTVPSAVMVTNSVISGRIGVSVRGERGGGSSPATAPSRSATGTAAATIPPWPVAACGSVRARAASPCSISPSTCRPPDGSGSVRRARTRATGCAPPSRCGRSS